METGVIPISIYVHSHYKVGVLLPSPYDSHSHGHLYSIRYYRLYGYFTAALFVC